MDHAIHSSHPSEPHEKPEQTQGYTLRIPKLNWQVSALILIAIIAGFQTFQLARLKGSVTAKAAAPAATAAAPQATSTANSGLQSQVGGC